MGDGGQSWGRYPGRNFLSHKINRRMATKQGCSEDNTALREPGKRVPPFPWTGSFGCPKFAPGFGQVSRCGGGDAPQPSLGSALSVSLRRKGEASSAVAVPGARSGYRHASTPERKGPPNSTRDGSWCGGPRLNLALSVKCSINPRQPKRVFSGGRQRGAKRGGDPGEQRPGWSPSP